MEACKLLDARLQGASLPLSLAARVIIRGDVDDFAGNVEPVNWDRGKNILRIYVLWLEAITMISAICLAGLRSWSYS
jgi:hypothetical protein